MCDLVTVSFRQRNCNAKNPYIETSILGIFDANIEIFHQNMEIFISNNSAIYQIIGQIPTLFRNCLVFGLELHPILAKPVNETFSTMTPFFRTAPLLYHKFENMVICRSGNLYSLCSPGNQDYFRKLFIFNFFIKKVEIDKRSRNRSKGRRFWACLMKK